MNRHINVTMLMGLVLTVFISAFIPTAKAEALEPKLLWEKTLPFKIYDVKMAAESGDVILSSKEARQIILYDKNGNERFHWGPRIDRRPHKVSISADGKYFIYASSWTESYKNKKQKKDWDERLHYLARSGKELWSKQTPPDTRAALSPDAKYIAFAGVPGEGSGVELWDSSGGKLWVYSSSSGIEDLKFSADSKYLAANWGGAIKLFDLSGNSVLQEKGGIVITSVANDAQYIATTEAPEETGVRLLDKQGNIILQGSPDDLTLVSSNGAKGILCDKGGVKVYNLPDKTLINTYPYKIESRQTYFYPAAISSSGRYLTLAGSKISASSSNNIFIIDLVENKTWETFINNPSRVEIGLSNDGKYFLILNQSTTGSGSLLYYYRIF